jgi:gas vesicle protein GvpL/GvpF
VTGRSGVRPRNKATQGTRYLQQQLAVLRTAREVPQLAPIRPAIRRFVKDERVERRSGVITVHHLIPRAMAERYRAAVERAAGETGVRLFVSGPCAPYAFADNW